MLKNKGKGIVLVFISTERSINTAGFPHVLDLLIIYLTRLPTSLHGHNDQALIKEVTTNACSLVKYFLMYTFNSKSR